MIMIRLYRLAYSLVSCLRALLSNSGAMKLGQRFADIKIEVHGRAILIAARQDPVHDSNSRKVTEKDESVP